MGELHLEMGRSFERELTIIFGNNYNNCMIKEEDDENISDFD